MATSEVTFIGLQVNPITICVKDPTLSACVTLWFRKPWKWVFICPSVLHLWPEFSQISSCSLFSAENQKILFFNCSEPKRQRSQSDGPILIWCLSLSLSLSRSFSLSLSRSFSLSLENGPEFTSWSPRSRVLQFLKPSSSVSSSVPLWSQLWTID